MNKNKNKILIIGGLLLAGSAAAYFITKGQKATPPPETNEDTPTKNGGGSVDPNAVIKGKIKILQALLNVGVDGSAGKQTNEAAAKLLKISPITAANIDQAIKTAQDLKQSAGNKQRETAQAAQRLTQAWTLKNAFDKNKALKLTLLKSGTFVNKILNKTNNTYPGDGTNTTLSPRAYDRATLSEIIPLKDGHILIKYAGGYLSKAAFLYAHPNSFILT